MTRKHFIALAADMKAGKPASTKGAAFKAWLAAANTLADTCARTNPRFDRSRFLAACGV